MRLIDLDELLKFPIRIEHYDKKNGDEHFVYGVEAVLEYAENLPTIEPEVRHGRWIRRASDMFDCSECEESTYLICSAKKCSYYYCPNCGAKMDLRTPTEVELDVVDSVMMGDVSKAEEGSE